MSGKLLIRRDDGSLQAVGLEGAVRIGSSADSDLSVPGLLPAHARAGGGEGEYWIEDARDAGVMVNGERVVGRRTLRHLDVITLRANLNLIFSTTTPGVPEPPRPKRQPAAASPPPRPTVSVPRPAAIPRALLQTDAPGEEPTGNTIVQPRKAPPVPKFEPKFDSVETAPPTFVLSRDKAGQLDPPEAPTVILKAGAPRPITGVRLTGISGVYEARLGRSVIGRAADAIIRIDSKEVSRVHAVLNVSAAEVTIEDQGSVNGVNVNGVRAKGPQKLDEGDVVSFGTIELRVDLLRLGGD